MRRDDDQAEVAQLVVPPDQVGHACQARRSRDSPEFHQDYFPPQLLWVIRGTADGRTESQFFELIGLTLSCENDRHNEGGEGGVAHGNPHGQCWRNPSLVRVYRTLVAKGIAQRPALYTVGMLRRVPP